MKKQHRFLSALFASVICLPERVLATDNSTNAQKLMNSYYNAGKYSKHTEIFYIGAAGGSYDSSCFHAGVGNLIRDTEYVPGNLYMTNSEETINSGYKDVDGDMAHYKKVGDAEVIDYTVKNTTATIPYCHQTACSNMYFISQNNSLQFQ